MYIYIRKRDNDLIIFIKFLTHYKKFYFSSIDNVMVEKCICLTQEPNKEKKENTNLKPEIVIKSIYPIKEIELISEASLVEIFGKDNEYLFTCESNFIDEWEEMAVYKTKIDLPNLFYCNIKVICKMKYLKIFK